MERKLLSILCSCSSCISFTAFSFRNLFIETHFSIIHTNSYTSFIPRHAAIVLPNYRIFIIENFQDLFFNEQRAEGRKNMLASLRLNLVARWRRDARHPRCSLQIGSSDDDRKISNLEGESKRRNGPFQLCSFY